MVFLFDGRLWMDGRIFGRGSTNISRLGAALGLD